jgi:hypothetical protein
MTVLTVDEATLALLKQAREQVELRDVQGNFVGFFTPARSGRPYPTTPATEADLPELDRLRAIETEGKTLREIFEHLKTLTTNPAELAELDRCIREMVQRDQCPST